MLPKSRTTKSPPAITPRPSLSRSSACFVQSTLHSPCPLISAIRPPSTMTNHRGISCCRYTQHINRMRIKNSKTDDDDQLAKKIKPTTCWTSSRTAQWDAACCVHLTCSISKSPSTHLLKIVLHCVASSPSSDCLWVIRAVRRAAALCFTLDSTIACHHAFGRNFWRDYRRVVNNQAAAESNTVKFVENFRHFF